jgi:hypothetical protein
MMIAMRRAWSLPLLRANTAHCLQQQRQKLDGGTIDFFSIPEGLRVPHKGQKRGSQLEIISDGHYVLAAPSIHPSGIRYAWANDITEFAEAPSWLIQYAVEKAGRDGCTNAAPTLQRRRWVAEALSDPEPHSEKGEARIRDALRYLSADKEQDWFYRAAEIKL